MNPGKKEPMRIAIGKFLALVALGLTTTIYGGLALADVDPAGMDPSPVVEQRVLPERSAG